MVHHVIMIHVYTGNGKGKTTAALGLLTRAIGAGWKVAVVQFLKNDPTYGEYCFWRDKLPWYQFGGPGFVNPQQPRPIDYEQAVAALNKAVELAGQCDLLICDEINVALAWGLIKLNDLEPLWDAAKNCELVLTGRGALPEVIERADLVTEMREIKHYYNNGVQARQGVEF